MPMLIPLAAAAGSIFAGATAIGAGATLIGGAMIAGGALTAIGAVTKNNKLMKIGGLVSLAGGIGGLATGAWASTASTLAEQSGTSLFATSDAMNAAPLTASAAQGASSIAAPGGVYQAAIAQPASPGLFSASDAINAAPHVAAAAPSLASTLGDTVSGVGKWMSANKELVNTGAGIIGGASKQAAEQDLLNEKFRQEDEAIAKRRAQLSQSILGLQMPRYVPPTYAPQNYAPGTYAPQTYAPPNYAPNIKPKG